AVRGGDASAAAVAWGDEIEIGAELAVVGAKIEVRARAHRERRRVAGGVGHARAQNGHAIVEVHFRVIDEEMENVEADEAVAEIVGFALSPGPEPKDALIDVRRHLDPIR